MFPWVFKKITHGLSGRGEILHLSTYGQILYLFQSLCNRIVSIPVFILKGKGKWRYHSIDNYV